MDKILAVVVAYNPDIEEVKGNLDSYAPYVDRTLLWCNSPISLDYPNVELCGDGTNRGIPEALNYAWHYAEENGYQWLLTMDQDSKWENFSDFRDLALGGSVPEGIYTPRIFEQEVPGDFIPTNELITSGTLQSIRDVRAAGGWGTDFFLDAVDVDFHIRALRAGIKVYKLGKGHLIHHMGDVVVKKFLGKPYTTVNYSPKRLYGIYRNHWIVIRRYPEFAQHVKAETLHSYSFRIPRIILGEKDKFKKIWAIFKGTVAGLTYKINQDV